MIFVIFKIILFRAENIMYMIHYLTSHVLTQMK